MALILCLLLCFVSCNSEAPENTESSISPDADNNTENKVPQYLDYKLSEDESHYIVTGIGTYTDPNLIIPEEHNGLPVKEIKDGAFIGCDSIMLVTIPDTITTLSHNIFTDCHNILSVTIGKNVTEIKEYAFHNCRNLVEVVNKSPYVTITKDESNGMVGINALSISNAEDDYKTCISFWDNGFIVFDDGSYRRLMKSTGTDKRVVIDSSFSAIHPYAFYENLDIVWLEVEGPLLSIGEYAFRNCAHLISVIFNDTIHEIGKDAFYHCYSLVEVVSKRGPVIERYNSENNGGLGDFIGHDRKIFNPGDTYETILSYTDDGYILREYGDTTYILGYLGNETELTLPETRGIGEVGVYAFYKNEKIKSVTLGPNIHHLHGYSFAYCTSLERVTFVTKDKEFPYLGQIEGISILGSYAFKGCVSLIEIFIPKSVDLVYANVFEDTSLLRALCEHAYEDSRIFLPGWLPTSTANAYFGCTNPSKRE